MQRNLHDTLFQEINRQLEDHGIKVKKAGAALVDATSITSSARPRQTIEDGVAKKSADPDASWVRKGNKSFFGYRGYAIADGEKGFIHHVKVLPANESEIKQLPSLLKHVHGKHILTDKGFSSYENREEVRKMGIKDGLS